ncbi:hypothetical protein [Rhodopila globiformis]|uniref:Uncharacterized protein n=1 Tax=Rhodopila globiformis TaxID=1071 RepID=A0A2S6MUB7_RHOGL|nr:hypothetical protein [Rhodopila globiformis]PPQ25949.1 hypothetical protein CCS01_31345 [Rhodopila globiformis]
MRDLQKMSAGSIAALPHAVPVKSGATTVAVLVPIQKAPPELVARMLAQIDAAAASRSAEETARLAALVGEDPPE